jgi:hypothetical protein
MRVLIKPPASVRQHASVVEPLNVADDVEDIFLSCNERFRALVKSHPLGNVFEP